MQQCAEHKVDLLSLSLGLIWFLSTLIEEESIFCLFLKWDLIDFQGHFYSRMEFTVFSEKKYNTVTQQFSLTETTQYKEKSLCQLLPKKYFDGTREL